MGGRGPRNIKGALVGEAAFSRGPNVFLLLLVSNSFRFFLRRFASLVIYGGLVVVWGRGIPNSGNTVKN